MGQFISDDLKTQGTERVAELKAAIASSNSTVDDVRHCLDALQQTLLAIGASVYQQATEAPADDFAYSATEHASTTDYNLDTQPIANEDDDYGFDNDATITADYEAVD